MTFDGEYFQQFFGVIMGTNVAPILANIYMAKLEMLLKEKCKTDIKLKWPTLLDFEYWVSEFNSLRETITIDKFSFGNSVEFMDLYIYKGDEFFVTGKLDICVSKGRKQIYVYSMQKWASKTHYL